MRTRIEFELERPIYDWIVAVGLGVGYWGLAWKWPAFDLLHPLTAAQRADLYTKALGPLSILASMALAGLALFGSGSGPQMTALRKVHGDVLLKQFRAAAIAPGIVIVVLLACYVGEVGYHEGWPRWTVIGCVAFIMVRAGRVLFFYTGTLRQAGSDKHDEEQKPEPRASIDDLAVPKLGPRR